MIDRRDFLRIASLATAWPYLAASAQAPGVLVNDIHSQLNATRVHRIETPEMLDAVRNVIRAARRERRAVCIAGGRHAMGAQAFATDGVLIDIRKLDRTLAFDAERGLMEVESGMQWPRLLSDLTPAQRERATQWGFSHKQTGADRLTIGGCVSANVHGRGLTLPPFVGDAVVAALHGWSAMRSRDRASPWMLGGVALSIVAAAVQASGYALHANFNHNDIYHVFQIAAMWLFYSGVRQLRDRVQ